MVPFIGLFFLRCASLSQAASQQIPPGPTTAEWLTAIGTVSAVVIALVLAIYHEPLKSLGWRPKLEITFEEKPPDCHKTTIVNSNSKEKADCYYFRVRLHNKGNAAVQNAEISIEEIQRKRADGTFDKWEEFLPLNLMWSNFGTVFFTRISPGTYKHCDLGHIIDPARLAVIEAEDKINLPQHAGKVIMLLDLAVRPNTGTYILEPREYKLRLVAAASNAKPTHATLDINFKGVWKSDEDQMLKEGIGISLGT